MDEVFSSRPGSPVVVVVVVVATAVGSGVGGTVVAAIPVALAAPAGVVRPYAHVVHVLVPELGGTIFPQVIDVLLQQVFHLGRVLVPIRFCALFW